MPLAVRLTGKFKTAFPDGLKPRSRDKDKTSRSPARRRCARATNENSVILVADVDMLADGAAVDVQEIFGRKIVVPSNGNLAFALGMVEQFAAGNDLISLRSRASAFRPLTVVRELEAEAQKQYFGKIQALEDELQKTNAKLQELQKAQGSASEGRPDPDAPSSRPSSSASGSASPRPASSSRKCARTCARTPRRWSSGPRWSNIALMPLLVALFGLGVALIRRRRVRAA